MGSAAVQGDLWGAAARDWAELQDPMSTPLWEAMLAAAGVGPGTKFLDAGCGAGGASALAAERGARVSGFDASEALLAIARERVPEGDFRSGDLEALPYPDGAFDAVFAANSVQYAADPVAALRELRRVCAESGRVVLGIWAPLEECEMRDVFQAIGSLLPPPPSGGGPAALSAPGALAAMMEQAGLRVIGSGTVDCPFEYPDLETAWRANRSAGVVQGAMRAVGEERLKAAVVQALERHRTGGGRVRLENRFRYVTAARA
jgi:SAM-dependent methyltransferase